MKTPAPLALAAALAAFAACPAAAQAPAAPPMPVQQRALLVYEGNDFEEVWIERATTTQIQYREQENAIDRKIKDIATIQSIYLYEPPAFTLAMDLYQGRRFEEAMAQFRQLQESLKGLRDLPNNHGTLAGFYALECLRHLGDLDGLNKALEQFRGGALTRRHHQRQLELYILWNAVHTKSWDRLELLCKDRRKEPMPGYQRAQVAYCHGLALEGLDKPLAALNAYAAAMTADYGASIDLVRDAALNSLRIHANDPEVQRAMKVWETDDDNPNAAGRFRLIEAGALANTYELTLGGGKALPEPYKKFLAYKPKDATGESEPAPPPEKKPEAVGDAGKTGDG